MPQDKKEKSLIIETVGLEKEFRIGDRMLPVLRGIDLEIYDGVFAIVYGPSGCGKSTLLHTILGLEQPTKGIIRVNGVELFKMDENERANFRGSKIGMVFQQANWIRSLNVMDNVALPLNIAGWEEEKARKKAIDVLQLFGLQRLAERHPSELSGGEQQRINLARSLTTDPQIVLADEPTGNLDKKAGLQLMGLLRSLNEKSNKTIVLVTHNSEYYRYASQLLQMEDGQIIGNLLRDRQSEFKPVMA